MLIDKNKLNRRSLLGKSGMTLSAGLALLLQSCGSSTPMSRSKSEQEEASADEKPVETEEEKEAKLIVTEMEGELGVDYAMVQDFHAYNIYFDGTRGPKTGIIKATKMQLGKTVDLEFWHGHGGKNHRFVVTQKEYQQIIRGKVVDIQTDSVQNHTHTVRLDAKKSRGSKSKTTSG